MATETPIDQTLSEDPVETSDLIELLKQRTRTYELISRLYRVEVDEDFLAELKTMRFPVSTGNASADSGFRAMATYLAGTWENSVLDLAIDYVRTFIGNGVDTHAAAYPFESVYTSERRLLMQDARDEVLAIYRSLGLEKGPHFKESEDHIAAETELMAILSRRTVEALCAGDENAAVQLLETQRNFLEDHLASWAPMLTLEMRRFAKTGLYQGLASLTDGFIGGDVEFLAEILSDEEDSSSEADGETRDAEEA